MVREAFAKRGHYALSCDLLSSELPGKHYQGDVRSLLSEQWDLLIAFPPCTYLARSGARWWRNKRREQAEAIAFVQMLRNASIPRIAIENPIGKLSKVIGPPTQVIQPWQFGHGEVKTTCLWLQNLPLLVPTKIVEGRVQRSFRMGSGPEQSKNRSRTLPGIAQAMAEQWS